jgi:adenosylcobyric acid synthase
LTAKCLAILGTGSDVGKSIVATAFCRIFSDLGLRVAPFKAQNMSNNSFVTAAGGEMGRAQVVQAQAARVPPHVDMNPVLLKPSADTGAQVVVLGEAIGNCLAKDYFADTSSLARIARQSLKRLCADHDVVVMEGAGSCAEVNLRPRDFVNFRMAHPVDAPVILVADIDRGGVFGQIIGTLAVLPKKDRQRIRGFIINRFRGDADLFRDGIAYLEKQTGLPVLGLIPYFRHIEIDSEDGMPLDILLDPPSGPQPDKINVAVLRVPHISNFTDFQPFHREPGVRLHYLAKLRPLAGYDLVFLPGSKNVRSDLQWLRQIGWERALRNYAADGGRIGGICGGYQMLGRSIQDPDGLEGNPGKTAGLGLLAANTTLQKKKALSRSTGVWNAFGEPVEGYEIHMGVTRRSRDLLPAIRQCSRNNRSTDGDDGAVSPDGKIWGTYFHGLFDSPGFLSKFLAELGKGAVGRRKGKKARRAVSASVFREKQYDLLADHFRKHLDLPKLFQITGIDVSINRTE